MLFDSPLSLIFTDVFFRLNHILRQTRVILKLEGFSITGSIKIKTALYMVDEVERQGLAKPGITTLVESSSGNLGVALSLVSRRRGFRFVCVTDPNISETNVRAMQALGAKVIIIRDKDPNGGYVRNRIAHIKRLLNSDPTCVWLNQYASEANINAHYEMTASEILNEFPSPDFVFVGAGSTGTLMGCARHFGEFAPTTQLIAVEPHGSVIFGGAPAQRLIPGIGSSRRPELLDQSLVHRVVTVSEPDAIRMCHRIAVEHGLLVGGSTGSIIAAIQQCAETIPEGAVVIAVSPDMGEKYLDTIYSSEWVVRNYGFDPYQPSLESELPGTLPRISP